MTSLQVYQICRDQEQGWLPMVACLYLSQRLSLRSDLPVISAEFVALIKRGSICRGQIATHLPVT